MTLELAWSPCIHQTSTALSAAHALHDTPSRPGGAAAPATLPLLAHARNQSGVAAAVVPLKPGKVGTTNLTDATCEPSTWAGMHSAAAGVAREGPALVRVAGRAGGVAPLHTSTVTPLSPLPRARAVLLAPWPRELQNTAGTAAVCAACRATATATATATASRGVCDIVERGQMREADGHSVTAQ